MFTSIIPPSLVRQDPVATTCWWTPFVSHTCEKSLPWLPQQSWVLLPRWRRQRRDVQKEHRLTAVPVEQSQKSSSKHCADGPWRKVVAESTITKSPRNATNDPRYFYLPLSSFLVVKLQMMVMMGISLRRVVDQTEEACVSLEIEASIGL